MREKATIEKAKEDQREGRTALVGVGAALTQRAAAQTSNAGVV